MVQTYKKRLSEQEEYISQLQSDLMSIRSSAQRNDWGSDGLNRMDDPLSLMPSIEKENMMRSNNHSQPDSRYVSVNQNL